MGSVILYAVFLLLLCQIQESRAVTPLFVQKGKDVLLEADVPEKFLFLIWRFNTSDVLVTFTPDTEPEVTEDYTGRVEFTVKKYSVNVKNLQETDSGVYTAQLIRIQEKQIVAQYIVIVQDPVSPVVLTVDSVSSSSNSCKVTVTCSTQDFHIRSTFGCDTQTCSQEGGERSKVTTSGASLQVSMVNDSIICNHSNHISWAKNMTKIQDFCRRYSENKSWNHVIIIVCVLIGFTVAFLLMIRNVLKKRNASTTSFICSHCQGQEEDHAESSEGETEPPSSSLK